MVGAKTHLLNFANTVTHLAFRWMRVVWIDENPLVSQDKLLHGVTVMKCTEQPVTRRHIVPDESYSQIHNLLYYASSSEFATKKGPFRYSEWNTAWGFHLSHSATCPAYPSSLI